MLNLCILMLSNNLVYFELKHQQFIFFCDGLNVKKIFFYRNIYVGLNVKKKIKVIFAALICILVSANLRV